MIFSQSAVQLAEQLAASQFASLQFVVAIQGPFFLALLGAAITLKRPGSRVLTLVYGLFSLVSVGSALLAWMQLNDVHGLDSLVVGLTGMLIGAGWSETRHVAQLMAGQPVTPHVRLTRMALCGLGFGVVLFGIDLWSAGGAGGETTRLMQRSLVAVLLSHACFVTLRESRDAAGNLIALRLIALGYAAVVVRVLVTMLAEVRVALELDVPIDMLIAVNAGTAVLNGVTFLLAAMVEERAAILEQSVQLRAMESQLGAARRLESLGEMAGGVAHDFANVLTVIHGALSSARREPLTPSVAADLADAEVAAERATALTRQLRNYAHQGQHTVTRFGAAERLDALMPVLKRITRERSVLALRCTAPANAHLEMEPSQFDQIPLNLVINARDAMPQGGRIEIDMHCEQVDFERTTVTGRLAPGRYVHLRVTDTGVGIPASSLPHIFEPFFTTKGDRGTGLGLATVFRIVRRQFGHVDVTSREGHGTRFDVWFPAAD